MKFYVHKQTGEIAITRDQAELCDACKLLVPNTTDAAQEKHVPVVKVDGDTVCVEVGSVTHPMTAEHQIAFIVLETDKGYQQHCLKSTDAPKTEFKLTAGEKAVAVYEYCNLHGLWMTKL
ncbi:MAG: desulfoferrodoxin [Clostridiales bacterium]|nr:desulfoferrodoxin [Clostridiales bacterium]